MRVYLQFRFDNIIVLCVFDPTETLGNTERNLQRNVTERAGVLGRFEPAPANTNLGNPRVGAIL